MNNDEPVAEYWGSTSGRIVPAAATPFNFVHGLVCCIVVGLVLYLCLYETPVRHVRVTFDDGGAATTTEALTDTATDTKKKKTKKVKTALAATPAIEDEDEETDEPEVPAMTANEQSQDQQRRAYISKYAAVAQGEQRKHGIPASIKLAQGLLESKAGTSGLATRNRNHFGIKCFSRRCGRGHCSNYTDDTHKDFFLIYTSVWASYRAHSEFLKATDRYRRCFQCGPTDYRCWARELKAAGYATSPTYAEDLIRIIELYRLYRYDQAD